MPLNSLDELFLSELKDLLSAEKQILRALPKMAKGASTSSLKKAFESHLQETKVHVERLEKVFATIGKTARPEHCDGMEGLLKEGAKLLEEEGNESVIDAALIGAAQRVEHYEIAAYGTTRTLAELLGNDKAVKLLQETLDEEMAADEKLTDIATSEINLDAEDAEEDSKPKKAKKAKVK